MELMTVFMVERNDGDEVKDGVGDNDDDDDDDD